MSEAAPLLRHLMAPLSPWLENPETEEVCINRPGEAFVRQRGRFVCRPVPLKLDDLEDIAVLAGALRKQDVGRAMPLCSTELPDGERLQVVLPPAVPGGTVSLTIRKPGSMVHDIGAVASRYQKGRWNQWQDRKEAHQGDHTAMLALFDKGNLEAFLHAAVTARLNILLCGSTGSGKTTMSKTLVTAIDSAERILTIEDTLELVIPQPNHVRLLYSHGGQSGANISAESLLEASLRMRPDRVLVQELRTSEAAWTYINEVVSGHPGSITTIHGRGAAQAFKKLFALVKGSAKGGQWDDATLIGLLATAVEVIIPFENHGATYAIGEVWFAPDAARRHETAAELLRDS